MLNQISEYPFTPKDFKLRSGHKLSYILEGNASADTRPVVMLHGNPTWSYYYRHLISALVPVHCVLAPDHIGMGLSDKPQDYNYCLKNHIDNTIELIDSLGLKDVTLVVHDWGGAIGHGIAVSRPDLVGAIVSMNTAAFTSLRLPLRIGICKIPFVGEWLVRSFNAFAWPATFMAVQKPLSRAVKKAYIAPYNNYRNRIATSRFVQDIPLHNKHQSYKQLKEIEDQLPKLNKLPKIYIWGEKDFCFTTHFLYRFTHFFPQAKSYIFADGGHYILEDEREKVIAIVQEFLNEYRR